MFIYDICHLQMTVQMLTDDAAREENSKDLTLLHQLSAQNTEAHTESVTVTLTQNPEQGNAFHILGRSWKNVITENEHFQKKKYFPPVHQYVYIFLFRFSFAYLCP